MNNIYGWYRHVYEVKAIWVPIKGGEQVHFVINVDMRLLNGKNSLGSEFGKMAIESLV